MTDSARTHLHRRATDRRAAALHQWQSLSGGVSACALARSGVSFPAGKLAEGRVAALGELLRALKKLPDDSSPAPLLTDLRDEWRTEAETAEAKYAGGQDSPDGDGSGPVGSGPGMSRDWIAYRVGGADELDELLLELSGAATDGAADV
ncbi:hypothetical protein [uncultured Corynebacterium sp.]|uniref:hypothetical protein n=1 Tax=uncultured Corynebacterium sp. TaxID=159447 RepID=UPI002614FBB7|nr:hypothetical protein [uncultured Corynebacterium sp.]